MLHYFRNIKFFYKVIKSFQCFPINFKSYDNLNICLNDLSFITFKFSKHSFYKLNFTGKIQLLEEKITCDRSVLFMSPRQNLSTVTAVKIFGITIPHVSRLVLAELNIYVSIVEKISR